MGDDTPRGDEPPEVEAQFGKRLWGPPLELEERAKARRRAARLRAMALFGLGLFWIVGAAFVAGPGNYGVSTGWSAAGGLLALLGTWFLYRANRQDVLSLGVFEKGALLPSSFESAPGLATMGGSVFIRHEEIDRVEDMRAGDERAIVVWSKVGRSGLMSARSAEGLGADAARAAQMVDEFLAALGPAGHGGAADEPDPEVDGD